MAKIDPYEQQVSAQGSIGGRNATSSDFGFGQGVSALAEGLGQYAEYQNKRVEQDAEFQAAKTYNDGMTQWKTYFEKAKQGVPSDPDQAKQYVDGLTDNFVSQYDDWQQKQIESMPTNKSKQALTLHLSKLKGSMIDDVMRYQATETGRLKKESLQDTLQGNENLAFSSPQSVGNLVEAETTVIRSAGLPGDMTSAWLRERKQALYDNALQGSVQAVLSAGENVPTSEITSFRDGLLDGSNKLAKEVSPSALKQAVHTLTAMEKTRGAQDAKLQLDDLQQRIEERQAGIDNGLKKDAAAFIPDPIVRARMEKAIDTAVITGDATKSVESASYGDLVGLASLDRKKLEQPGNFDQDKTVAAARLSAIQARMKQENDDFAGYAMRTSPVVAAAFDELQKTKYNQQDPGPYQKKLDNYVGMLTAEQQRLNPLRPTALLPTSQADAIASDLVQRINNGNAPGEALLGEANKWGKYWPQVFGQIGAKLPPDAYNIGTGMRPADANYLASLSQLKPEELKRGIDGSQLSGIEATIAKKYADFTHSMTGLPGGDAIIGKVMASNEKMIYGYMRQGMSVNDAVDKSYDALVGHKYQFAGSIRVPSTIDAGKVAGGTANVLRNLDNVPLDIPLTPGVRPEDAAKQWRNDVKTNGVWFANQDETGAALYIKDRTGLYTAVKDTKGQPIEYSWKSLTNKANYWWWNNISKDDLTPDARVTLPTVQPGYKGAVKAGSREGKR